MEDCFFNVFWLNHYIRCTKNYRFIIIGKRENQWYDKVNINCVWWQKIETWYNKAFAILCVSFSFFERWL